jgi:ribonuclease HI
VLQSILKKLNVRSTIPTAIRHGPREMGGIDLYDLVRTEVGIESIKFLRDAIYADSESGKLIRLNLQYSLLEAGFGESLLEYPNVHLAYLTPTWILSILQFLSCHNMTITISDSFRIPLNGLHDEYIMQPQHLSRYSPSQQRGINLVRLFLQVNTLSEMSDPHRRNAIDLCYLGGKHPVGHTSNPSWPRQQTPTKPQLRLWKGFIKSSYLRYIPYWKTPSTAPTLAAPAVPVAAPTSFPSNLFSFLASLPKRQRRLMDQLEQWATDDQVWRAFRSRKRISIATDGGLAQKQGTHGWVISLGTRTLFQCAGPADGPVGTASSTRSELCGYASAVTFLHNLSKILGIRLRSRFTWYCDSKAALARVRRFASRTSFRRRMPSDVDLLSLIQKYCLSLKCRFRHRWVKGH